MDLIKGAGRNWIAMTQTRHKTDLDHALALVGFLLKTKICFNPTYAEKRHFFANNCKIHNMTRTNKENP